MLPPPSARATEVARRLASPPSPPSPPPSSPPRAPSISPPPPRAPWRLSRVIAQDAVEVCLPHHHALIRASAGEVISVRRKLRAQGGALVSVEGVEQLALAQVPHLDGVVVGRGEEEVARGVERHRVDVPAVRRLVMLHQLLAAHVPQLHDVIVPVGGDRGAVGVELGGVHRGEEIVKLVDARGPLHVPQAHRLIVRRRRGAFACGESPRSAPSWCGR